jgi:hypothetical protein
LKPIRTLIERVLLTIFAAKELIDDEASTCDDGPTEDDGVTEDDSPTDDEDE